MKNVFFGSINNHLVDKYKNILEMIKGKSKIFNNEISNNKKNLNKYLMGLLNK
mgnify:CR=1 FL=1